MKKLAIAFGALFGLLLLTAIVVPLVVDVDKYRPQIVSKAGEYLNGKLELGKLGLSLWGRVHVSVDGLKLSDAKGRAVVEVKDASFNLPFTSLLAGRPEVRLQLVNPSVSVVKDKDGKMNALTLVKEQPPQGKSAQASSGAGKSDTGTSTATGGGKGTEVPAMVMNARLTFLLEHAKLDYKDLVTGDSYDVTDLNVRLEDVSPSSTMPFEVTANLDLLVQKRIKVAGPLTFDGEVKATSSGGNFDKADVKASLKLDGLEINDPGLFEKKRGVPLGAELTANAGKDSFAAPKIVLRLASVEIDAQATGKTANNATTVDFKMHSNKIDLAKLGELSPLITQYGVNGLVELSATASGPTDKLGYGATLKFNKIALSNEALKQPLEVNGSLAVATNELKDLTVKLTAAKGFDLSVNGSMQNFMAPKFRFKIASNEMDLDGLLKASEKAAQTRKEHADAQMSGAAPAEGKHATPPVVDYNAMFEPLRKIPMAAMAAGTVDFGLKRIKSTGVVIEGLSGQLALNNLALALKDFTMKIFDGSIKGGMSFNVKPAKPEVATSLTVTGLQTQKMVESSMPIARNTVKGAISSVLTIGGSGLNQGDIVANWKGNGSMDIKDAVFSTLDVGRQVK
ncbi:MAG: AsmA family protein, partial [Deltaproteobacteria bacterium]|nr:AsmA family protein [Deltaproteobacteria bacterium]